MTTHYVEYDLDDGTKLWIETKEDQQAGWVKTSAGGNAVQPGGPFAKALAAAKTAAKTLQSQLQEIQADEIEVEFGLTAAVEAGSSFFAIGKASTEATYKVTLKWKSTS